MIAKGFPIVEHPCSLHVDTLRLMQFGPVVGAVQESVSRDLGRIEPKPQLARPELSHCSNLRALMTMQSHTGRPIGSLSCDKYRVTLLRCLKIVLLLAAVHFWHRPASADTDDEFFESKIRPILVEKCYDCHSSERGKTQGGLTLDSRQGLQNGGESGAAVVPGNAEESLLIRAVRYSDAGLQMPPEDAGGKLPDLEISLLAEWVRRGAHDPRVTEMRRGGKTEKELHDWWSFQPLQTPLIPQAPQSDDIHNEIDAFVDVKLAAEGLAASDVADRRTLIRRATYDLAGLPPSPEDVAEFIHDKSPNAYASLIDRLLVSPRYGEQWGRHWLDVVRYADTAGENSDHPIPDAWRYRNWVIDAFNNDLPYDQFIREQVAGDLIHKNDSADRYASGLVSTGFLAIARRFEHDSDKHMHLTFEDTIDTMGKAFMGLSIACARCHDHKYDPISAKDYYAIYGILNSTKFAFPGCEAKQQPRDLLPLLPPDEWAKSVAPHERQLAGVNTELKQLEDRQNADSSEFQTADRSASTTLATGGVSDGGAASFEEMPENRLSSVDVKAGQLIQLTVDPDGNYGADTTLIDWEISEIGGDERHWNLTQDVVHNLLVGNPHADRNGNDSVWLFLDGRTGNLLPESVAEIQGNSALNAWRNGDNPAVFVNHTDQPINVWTTLPALSLFLHPAPDGPAAIGWMSPMTGKVCITGRISDGHPGGPNGVNWSIDQFANDFSPTLQRIVNSNTRRAELLAIRAALVAHAPKQEFAYAVTEGDVANAKLHLRGDPERLGEEVPRRWLELFGGQQVSADSGSGRMQLAEWLSDRKNPLTARVMVNRIWQYHFGKGIVPTPNDFGTRGQLPTHPELLDWLSVRFIECGWSVKSMHRVIMLSSAYRQSSVDTKTASNRREVTIDPNNNLYWQFDRRRLSAEELRDSLLAASQQLDLNPRGPHPIPPTSGWSFSQHVPFAGVPETDGRSVYQITVRNRRQPFMALFDGADPNATTPLRQVTTVPTQALYFMNDPFFHDQSAKVASRVLSQASDDSSRLNLLFEAVFQRLPTDDERDAGDFLIARYNAEGDAIPADQQRLATWSAFARVLLASNEFLYLD